MSAKNPKQLALLAVLLVVLAGVLYRTFYMGQATAPGAPSNTSGQGAPGAAGSAEVTEVRLELLQAESVPYTAPRRDPFRFKPKPAPPPPPPPPVVYTPPPGPPPPPAISSQVRVLGIVGSGKLRVAWLSDGTTAPPLRAIEGEVVLGKFRVLRVDADAVEMAYTDGSGRQRIPIPPPNTK